MQIVVMLNSEFYFCVDKTGSKHDGSFVMIEYNDEIGAYVIEYDDVFICWEEEPDDDYREIADDVRNAYNRNIKHIAEVVFAEIKEIFDVADVDEVISKLGKPQIYIENEQVVYCENSFDDTHIISFEYSGDEFNDIQYVSIDG